MAAEDVEHDADGGPDPQEQEANSRVVSNASPNAKAASGISGSGMSHSSALGIARSLSRAVAGQDDATSETRENHYGMAP